MKLERLQEYVVPVVTTLAGMGFAFAVGKLLGQGQVGKAAMMMGILFLGFATMILRQYIWLLLIVAWQWTGSVPQLPVPLSIRDLSVGATFAAVLALVALKVVRRKPVYRAADFWMGVMLLYLVTVFVRNPVGFLAVNSERVGGRPYFTIGIACLAYWVLSRASIPVRSGGRIVLGIILANTYTLGILNAIADLFPRAAMVMTTFYTGFAVTEVEQSGINSNSQTPDDAVERLSYLGGVGITTNQALFSIFRPETLLNPLHFGRFLVLGASTYCILLSGFRTGLIGTCLFFGLATYLRSGWVTLVKMAGLGVVFLGLLVAGNGTLYELPNSAQRALSFLPGKWSYAARESAASSSEWRFQMWRIFLTGNKYVHNQIFGDGFGVTKRDMAAIAMAGLQGQENALIVGNVHSGPLSTVRFVGYFGLGIYVVVMGLMARDAWRLVRRARGTPFFSLALFVGVPIVCEPFNFILIFGAYDAALPLAIYSLGMLKMLHNTLDDYVGEEAVPAELYRGHIAEPEHALARAAR